MEFPVFLAACGFIPCLIGLGIYLLIDTVENHIKIKRRLAATEESARDAPIPTSAAVHQLNYRVPSPRNLLLFPRPGAKAVFRCVLIVLAYLGLSTVFVYYELRTRRVSLTFVDSATGAPVPIALTYLGVYFAQITDSPDYKFNAVSVAPNVVQVDWNRPTALSISQAGYKELSLDLDEDESPQVIRLQPINPLPLSVPPTSSIAVPPPTGPAGDGIR